MSSANISHFVKATKGLKWHFKTYIIMACTYSPSNGYNTERVHQDGVVIPHFIFQAHSAYSAVHDLDIGQTTPEFSLQRTSTVTHKLIKIVKLVTGLRVI